MSVVYSATDLEKGVRASLAMRVPVTEQILLDRLCDRFTLEAEDQKHEYLGDPPQMDEFKATRKITPFTDRATTIVSKVFDAAVRLKRDDLRRSQGGQINIARQTTRLVNTVLGFPHKRITDLIVNGTNTTSGENLPYDEVSFFNDSHPALGDEGGTQDNLLAGTGTTTAAVSTDLNTVKGTFFGVTGTNGEPFFGDGFVFDILVMAPPELEKPMREALNATIISNTTNVQVGMADLFINPRLTDADDWYAFVTNPGFEPLAWQDDQPIEVDVTAEDSELWKTERQAEVGVSQAVGAGYLYWQSAIKVTN